jgi:hypothetical protein
VQDISSNGIAKIRIFFGIPNFWGLFLLFYAKITETLTLTPGKDLKNSMKLRNLADIY